MDHIDSFEGKLFYKIYMLCKGNQINPDQKARLKDLVIQKDERLGMAMTQYLEDKDEWRLLENLHNYSCEDCSPKSYSDDNLSIGNSSKYKGKRPAKMQLPLKTFMINLRKNTGVTTSSKGFYTSTARSGGRHHWSECE